MSTYAFESAERLICCFLEDGKWNLAKLDTRTRRFDLIPTRFTDLSQLRASPGRVVFIGGTPTEPSALIDLDLNTGAGQSSSALGSSERRGPLLCFKSGVDNVQHSGR